MITRISKFHFLRALFLFFAQDFKTSEPVLNKYCLIFHTYKIHCKVIPDRNLTKYTLLIVLYGINVLQTWITGTRDTDVLVELVGTIWLEVQILGLMARLVLDMHKVKLSFYYYCASDENVFNLSDYRQVYLLIIIKHNKAFRLIKLWW